MDLFVCLFVCLVCSASCIAQKQKYTSAFARLAFIKNIIKRSVTRQVNKYNSGTP